jgi:5-methylcytosine-specific restriction protein A
MPTRPPTHRPKRLPVRDDRPSAASRGYGGRWRKLRLIVLAEEPVCRMCGREASEHVDHIVARAKGGSDERENLQGLCASCHARKTARHDGGFGR